MEFITNIANGLVYVYSETFWLKECFTIVQSLIVFLLVRWFVNLKQKVMLLLILSAFIGLICSFASDMGYFSDNDVLKHLAPSSLYLLRHNKHQNNKLLLFAFLSPFLIISYEPYRGLFIAIISIFSHLLIASFILFAKSRRVLSLLISIAIGVCYLYIGDITEPGTNDLIVNPMLITFTAISIGFITKNEIYVNFLNHFWAALLCLAYFGSWIFSYLDNFYTIIS